MTLSDSSTVNSPSPNPIKFRVYAIQNANIAMKEVIFYLNNSEMSNPGNLHPMMEPETMYSDLLKSNNIYHNNHSTTFADSLVKNVPK